jgi:hypothetical protein
VSLSHAGSADNWLDEADPHEADAGPIWEGGEADVETDKKVDEAARNSEAEGELEDSIERE